MNAKQRTLLVLKALFTSEKGEDMVSRQYIIEKLDACWDLERPNVLLDEEGNKRFEKFAEEKVRKGQLIYGKR